MGYKYDLKNEEGFSLVETLVSLSILVSVLLPVVLFLGYIGSYPVNKIKIDGLNRAQTEMETILNAGIYKKAKVQLREEGRWIIRQNIEIHGSLSVINVTVFRDDTSNAIVSLHNERFVYRDEEKGTN